MLAGEPVAIAGFIDHGGPGLLDEVLVEFANGEERTVRRDELTSMFDVIQGHWPTREVYLAGGRPNPAESLAVARHSPTGFGWGYGGSGSAQLALAILLRATDRETAVAHYAGVQVGRDREAAAGGLLPASRQGPRLARSESRPLSARRLSASFRDGYADVRKHPGNTRIRNVPPDRPCGAPGGMR